MFEAVSESLQFRFPKLSRKVTLVLLAVVCLGVGVNMEKIASWGPWMDIVSIYIIPIGATLGAISWFYVMKKQDLLGQINKSTLKPHGNGWYWAGRYLYVPCALILCIVALCMQIAF
jgi:NSS family neurotransmitter:Na+ symporter